MDEKLVFLRAVLMGWGSPCAPSMCLLIGAEHRWEGILFFLPNSGLALMSYKVFEHLQFTGECLLGRKPICPWTYTAPASKDC